MSITDKKNILIEKINSINDDDLIEELIVTFQDFPSKSDFNSKWENSKSSEEFIENMKKRIHRIAVKYDKISS